MALDFSLASQLEKSIEILKRDLSYIMQEASSKKLSPSSARDLVAYIKLLSELRDLELDDLKGLSDEALEALADGNPVAEVPVLAPKIPVIVRKKV